MVDEGDSGGGCFVASDDGVSERVLVGVAVNRYLTPTPAGQPPSTEVFAGLAARIDAFLPWLERTAYTRPSSLASPVESVLLTSPLLPVGSRWDDGHSIFTDLTGDGFDDFVYFGDAQRIHVFPGKGAGAFAAVTTYDHAHDPDLVVEARWLGKDPTKLPARGFRSRLVAAFVNTTPAYEGVYTTTRFDDGANAPTFDQPLPGAKWTKPKAIVSLLAGPHFDPGHESLVAQRRGDPATPGDTGEVVLVPGDAAGGFPGFATRSWPIPSGYADESFDVADINGDGGVDLVLLRQSGALTNHEVFLAVPGGTWQPTSVKIPVGQNAGVGNCSLRRTKDSPGLVDVTGDGRADFVCANGSGIFVRPGLADGKLGSVVVTPFEITGRAWNDGVLQDLDGDGFRDYVTFRDGAMWFKRNAGALQPGGTATGHFGGIQRVVLPTTGDVSKIADTFDAARLRGDRPRSAAFVAEPQPGKFVLRELALRVRQD